MSTFRFFRHSTHFFRHYIPTEFVMLAALEFLALILSLYLGLETRLPAVEWEENLGPFLPKALVFAGVIQMSFIALGAYQRQSRQAVDILVLRLFSSMLLALLPFGLIYYMVPMFFLGRGVMAVSFVYAFTFIFLIRLFFMRISRERKLQLRVLVLGGGKTANLVREAQTSGELKGINLVGYVPLPGDSQQGEGDDLVFLDGTLIEYVERNRIDEVVLASDDRRKGLPVRDLLDCRMSGVEVVDLLTFFERETGKIRLDIMNPSWLYLSDGFRESTFRRLGKRTFDVVLVLLLLPIVLPLMVLIAVVIFLESGGRGSVFYSQTRVSEDGKPFRIVKFRSMVANAEQDGVPRWAQKNDSRITRIGKILRKGRFDELPQLINVLRGEMSFIGPRPERPEFVAELAKKIPYYEERHRVKPGLTGWAQIRYPYGATEEDSLQKLQYDLYYVKNYSIMLDLLILLQTLEVVLLGKGAH